MTGQRYIDGSTTFVAAVLSAINYLSTTMSSNTALDCSDSAGIQRSGGQRTPGICNPSVRDAWEASCRPKLISPIKANTVRAPERPVSLNSCRIMLCKVWCLSEYTPSVDISQMMPYLRRRLLPLRTIK
ncbi:hypothetical protein TNCV_2687801 [Trichonephila clavipes]|nr:hypothetical protein TNCV_2687801 [Trichonephila clavipes]